MPQKIIIDTDPGIDDAIAIFMALRSPEVDVIGLTTIFGNHQTDIMTTNALRLLEIAGRADIPVAQGAVHPLVGVYHSPPVFVHGDDGQGNLHLPPPQSQPIDQDAARFIIEQVKAHPGDITLVCVGPLTNAALALKLEPRITSYLKNVVIMGGNALCPGNATPAAEANIYKDPEAADAVFGADWHVTMVGLDVTQQVIMNDAQIATIAQTDNSMAQHLGRIIPFYRDFYRAYVPDGIHLHDPTAIAYLLKPEVFSTQDWVMRVQCEGVGRGKTFPMTNESRLQTPPFAPWRDRPRVRVCVGVDADAVLNLTLDRIIS